MAEQLFQSLIGLIVSSLRGTPPAPMVGFQSLIGLIVSRDQDLRGAALSSFQSLIGLIVSLLQLLQQSQQQQNFNPS